MMKYAITTLRSPTDEVNIGSGRLHDDGCVHIYLDAFPTNGQLIASPMQPPVKVPDPDPTRDALLYAADRLFRLANEMASVATDKSDCIDDTFEDGDVEMVSRILRAFGSYISCVAEDGTFIDETASGLVGNLRLDMTGYGE